MDEALTREMNEMFFEGLPGTEGRKQLAALGYWIPFLTRGSNETDSCTKSLPWLDAAFSGIIETADTTVGRVPDSEPTDVVGMSKQHGQLQPPSRYPYDHRKASASPYRASPRLRR